MLKKNDKDSLISMLYLFSSSSVKKIIDNGDFSPINYRIKKHIDGFENYTYRDLIKKLYRIFLKNYKSEYFFKNTLLNKKLLGTYSLNTTVVFDEFRIGSSIADFILLNGEVRVFEIKTDLDSFDKIEKQVSDYKRFANKVYIVTSKKLINRAIDLYQGTNIGIIEFSNLSSLRTVQEAIADMTYFDHEVIFKTLRKDEYVSIIQDFYGIKINAPNTTIFKTSLELAKGIDISKFQELVFKKLKERKVRCPDLIKDKVPMELRHICYTLDLSGYEYSKLFDLLDTKIS